MSFLARHLRTIKLAGFLLALFGTSLSNSFCGIGMGIYLGALVLQALITGPAGLKPYPFRYLAAVLIASLCVSIAVSDFLWVSVKGLAKYLEEFILLYAGLDLIEKKSDRKALLNVLLAAYALACASAIWQHFFGTDFLRGRSANIYRDDIRRLTGPFKHCNDFGVWLGPGLPITIAAIVDARRHRQTLRAVACSVLLAIVAAMLLMTLSRSAILAGILSCLVFSLFFDFRRVALPAAALLLATLWFVPSPIQERLRQLPTLTEGTMSERIILMKTTLRMIDAAPYFGLGLNTYSDNYPRFKPADYPAHMYSHNSYLQTASEIGWIGLSLFLAFALAPIAWCARAIRRAPDRTARWLTAAFLAGVAGFLFNCLFESSFQSTQLRTYFWSLLGAALGLCRNGFLSGPDHEAYAKR